MLTRTLPALIVLISGFSGTIAQADEPKPLDRTELDKRLAKVAYDTMLTGVGLWKAEKYEGCFRLYQGTLNAIYPMLDHRPRLAAMVKDRLEAAGNLDPIKGSFALREALDAVQQETSQALVPAKKPLWDRLGGETVLRAVVKDFLDAALKDPKLDLTRKGKYKLDAKELETPILDILAEWTGGPAKPTLPNLRAILAGSKITDEEFDSLGHHVVAALKKNNVPEADGIEFLKILDGARKVIVGQ